MKLINLMAVLLLSITIYSCSKTETPVIQNEEIQLKSYQLVDESEDIKAQVEDLETFKAYLSDVIESKGELNFDDIAGASEATRYKTTIGERISNNFAERLIEVTSQEFTESQLIGVQDKRGTTDCFGVADALADAYGLLTGASHQQQFVVFDAYFTACVEAYGYGPIP